MDANRYLRYKHPYETEILHLQYPESVYEIRDAIRYQPVETTAATFVDTFEGVLEMLAELKKAKEIAIDTEHHDFRTYYGLLSLMQISTRDKDWVVDTLQPWRHKLEVLNEVFADPKILKVSNILCSQRRSLVTYPSRFCMAHTWMFSGCKETAASILSGCSTLSMQQTL
jgi:exosome complex exonuclease RRP6